MKTTIKDLILDGSMAKIFYKDGTIEERQLPVSSAAIEDFLMNEPLVRMMKDHDSDRINLPLQAIPFYMYFIKTGGKMLSQSKFLDKFISFYSENSSYVQSHSSLPEKGMIKNRLYRAYPSLVRDLHFLALCYDSGLFDRVEYSLRKDITDDTDLSVWKNGVEIKVSLFVNTRASQEWRKTKENEANDKEWNRVMITIDLESSKSAANKKGHYNLFGEEHIKGLSKAFTALKMF